MASVAREPCPYCDAVGPCRDDCPGWEVDDGWGLYWGGEPDEMDALDRDEYEAWLEEMWEDDFRP